jgi:tetracycline resistance efflux pump
MDPIQGGFLSILPPIIAIVLALITKEVISSLIVGTLVGTFTYAFASGHGFMKGVTTTFNLMAAKIGDNATMLLFMAFLGILVVLVTNAGGAYAYGKWASTKIKSKAAAQIMTGILGIIIFIDDYFNCLTVGTVMKPVTDKYNIARAKLAYLIDSTAAPVCIIAPISSWAAAVGATLAGAKIFDSDMMAFISTIPFNLYAILTIIMVFIVSATKLSYGPMRHLEIAAMNGQLGQADGETGPKETDDDSKGQVKDLAIPIVGLIILSVLAMLYTGGLFSGKGVGVAAAFGNCDSSLSLAIGGFGAIVLTFILYLPRKIMTFKDFMLGVTEGIKIMVPAITILILAWTVSGVCRDLLSTGQYVGDLVKNGHFPLMLLPLVIFVVAAFLSFAMGTARDHHLRTLHRYKSSADDSHPGSNTRRQRIRRSLLSDIGYHDTFIHRSLLSSHGSRIHADTLCTDCCRVLRSRIRCLRADTFQSGGYTGIRRHLPAGTAVHHQQDI